MNKKAIQIPNAPAPVGPYSQAILTENTLYVSGQIPLNPETGELEIETIELATKRVLNNIGKLLEAAGLGFENVVKCSIFLKDLNDFSAVNNIYATFFPGIPPARETVQVARLPLDVNIEISCIAVKN
jgi:2-iminobutanoate/2-iminopropanoate deaminase